ncbi:MAG TPA: LEA type 2 family protein [Spirochaetia bacterium]|nr:LEA type 2 family protein [Spirochaetia bacterium]
MKRTWLLLALLASAVPVMAFSLKAPDVLPKPTATLTRFEVSAITLRDVTFLFELTVDNPYPVPLSFSGMDLTFSVEGAKVFTAASQGGFKVPAKGKRANTFTVTLAYDGIIKVVKDYLTKDLLDTVIDGTLVIPLPKISHLPPTVTFSYSLHQKIPAIKPRLSVVDFRVVPPTQEQVRDALVKQGSREDPGKALGAIRNVLQGKKPEPQVIDPSQLDVPVSVSFTIELANEAQAHISFPKLGYELYVNGDKLVVGESTAVSTQGNRSLTTVVNTFSSRSLSANIRKLFTDRGGSFTLSGSASVKLPDEVSKAPLPLTFQEGGSFAMK